MKNIYLIGKVGGSYRTQHFIKYFLDTKFSIYYESMISWGPGGKFFELIEEMLKFPLKCYSLILAGLVFVTAMNQGYRCQYEFHLARMFKKPIITDYYISFYDSAVNDNGVLEAGSMRALRLNEMERNVILNSSRVIFLNSVEAKRYCKLAGAEVSTVNNTVIPLCVDEKSQVSRPYFSGQNDTLSVCWWGTYISLHGLETIIEAASILKGRSAPVRWFLFGNSEKKAGPYKELVDSLGLQEVLSIRNDCTFANGKLDKFLKEHCDIVLGNFGNSEKSRNVIVNKLIEGISMKAVVLSGESVATDEFFNYEDDIWKCQNVPKRLADCVERISRAGSDEIERRCSNAHRIYQEVFSPCAFAAKARTLLDEVGGVS